jgi:hypothetical protein
VTKVTGPRLCTPHLLLLWVWVWLLWLLLLLSLLINERQVAPVTFPTTIIPTITPSAIQVLPLLLHRVGRTYRPTQVPCLCLRPHLLPVRASTA